MILGMKMNIFKSKHKDMVLVMKSIVYNSKDERNDQRMKMNVSV